MTAILRVRQVAESEFWAHFHKVGGVYFIKDDSRDCIKVGHSMEPYTRLSNLQVGNPSKLRLVAAKPEIEPLIHQQLYEGRVQGEWFLDREVTSQWLTDMTQGEPMCRTIWEFVPSRSWLSIWHDETQSHTRHHWDDVTKQWEPPIPKGDPK